MLKIFSKCKLVCLLSVCFSLTASAVMAGTTRIGLYDAEHTKDDGYQYTTASGLTDSGYVRGYSNRYNGTASDMGRTALIYDLSAMEQTIVGLYDAEHTRAEGYKYSNTDDVTESGYARGYSYRYNGGVAISGRTAWAYDIPNSTQVEIGLYDAEHTLDTGYQYSVALNLTESGYAIGYSNRYNGGGASLGRTAWAYDIPNATQIEMGLYDGEHTRDDGYQYSLSNFVTESGYAKGSSNRYNGGAAQIGETAWVYDIPNTTLIEVGFYDAEHTNDVGYQDTTLSGITESGYASGISNRYNGGAAYLGQTLWIYDIPNTTLHEVGIYDVEHTNNVGYQYSTFSGTGIVESGYAIGISNRYNGTATDLGKTGWLYDLSNSNLIEIGLYDAEHTKDTGYQFTQPVELTKSGYARGYSYRYNGGAALLGHTVWVYDIPNSTQVEIGLYDAEHTRNDDYQFSSIRAITESGYVDGYSFRFNVAADMGRTAWIYDIPNTNQIEVGIYDAEHTRDTGYQFSQVDDITESGYARGHSWRYNGGNPQLGKTVWIYDIPNAVQLEAGIYDAEHTKNDGYQSSAIASITESGYAKGSTNRYLGGATELGSTAWVYDIPNQTQSEVGIYDLEHTRDDAYQYSKIDELTESGYASGYSYRYKGADSYLGRTAWLYHVPTATQVEFDFGEDVDTGIGWSNPQILLENGTLFGVFGHLDSSGHIDGERPFKGKIDGTKIDLFEEAGGDILNYHFEKDSVALGLYNDGEVIFGYGDLTITYHPVDSRIAFVLFEENPIVDNADNSNQEALATAIGGAGSYVGPYAVFFQYLLNYMSSDDASATLQQMVPQADSYARTVGRAGIRLVMDTITNNNFATLGSIGSGLGAGTSSAQSKLNQATSGLSMEDATLYGKYIYSKGSQDGDADHNGYEFDSNGIAFGADFARGDSGIFGMAIGFLETDIDGENNTGDIDQTSFSPNVYLGISRGKWILNAGLGYGFQQNDSERFSGINEIDKIKADWNSHSYSLFTSAAYQLKQTKDYSIDGVIGFDYMLLHEEDYTENAGDMWNMEIDSNTSDTFRSKLGIRILKDNTFKNGLKLKSEIRSFWLHDYLNEASTAVNSFNGSNSFTIDGLSLDRDRLQLGFTLDFLFTDKISVFLRYDTEISEHADRHEINTGLTYNF